MCEQYLLACVWTVPNCLCVNSTYLPVCEQYLIAYVWTVPTCLCVNSTYLPVCEQYLLACVWTVPTCLCVNSSYLPMCEQYLLACPKNVGKSLASLLAPCKKALNAAGCERLFYDKNNFCKGCSFFSDSVSMDVPPSVKTELDCEKAPHCAASEDNTEVRGCLPFKWFIA